MELPYKCSSRTIVALHGEMHIRDSAEDFIDLTDLGLVLKIERSVEIRNLRDNSTNSKNHHLVGRLAQNISLTLVHYNSHL